MIRFIDATEGYWTDGGPPCCVFIDTIGDTCVANVDGCHVFDSLEGVRAIPELGDRCARLVPDGFFDATADEPSAEGDR